MQHQWRSCQELNKVGCPTPLTAPISRIGDRQGKPGIGKGVMLTPPLLHEASPGGLCRVILFPTTICPQASQHWQPLVSHPRLAAPNPPSCLASLAVKARQRTGSGYTTLMWPCLYDHVVSSISQTMVGYKSIMLPPFAPPGLATPQQQGISLSTKHWYHRLNLDT